MLAVFGVWVDDPYADRGQCDDDSYCRVDEDCASTASRACKMTCIITTTTTISSWSSKAGALCARRTKSST